MAEKCEHTAAQVLYDYPAVIIYRCDGCSEILIGNEMGLNAIDDSDDTELAALRERLANNHAAMSIYQRDIKALRERVAALEAALKRMVYHFDCGIGNSDDEADAISDANILLRAGTAEGGE